MWGFNNLYHGEEARNVQFAAIPRMHAAITLLLRAQGILKGAKRLVRHHL